MNRRQKIAMRAFFSLNRERNYINTGIGLKPLNIKEIDIKNKYDLLTSPISFDIFKNLIQALDDVFVEFSLEQLKNGAT